MDPIFKPIKIKNQILKNRIIMAPMTRNFANDGIPAPFMKDYYGIRAKNQIGLIVTEGIAVNHKAAVGSDGLKAGGIPIIHSDEAIEKWSEIVKEVKSNDCVFIPQLWHQGAMRADGTGPYSNEKSLRPSGIWGPFGKSPFFTKEYLEKVNYIGKPMTESEIADVIEAFVSSAKGAMKAGFDGIGFHGAHAYLIDQFFWYETNKRKDKYGGQTLKERTRFGVELIKAVKKIINDKIIMFRFSQWKLPDYDAKLAATPQELETFLGELSDAGVDIFDVSTRRFNDAAFENSPLSLAGWTKKFVNKPVMAVGGIGLNNDLQSSLIEGGAQAFNNLDIVRQKLLENEFDLVGIGRSLLSNPDWAIKARDGIEFKNYSLQDAATKI